MQEAPGTVKSKSKAASESGHTEQVSDCKYKVGEPDPVNRKQGMFEGDGKK